MKLWDLDEGGKALISEMNDISTSERQLIDSMGLEKGSQIECLQKVAFMGPRLYRVEGTVLGIEKSLAEKLKVELAGDS